MKLISKKRIVRHGRKVGRMGARRSGEGTRSALVGIWIWTSAGAFRLTGGMLDVPNSAMSLISV